METPSGAPAPPLATTTQTQLSVLNTTLDISSERDVLDLAECSKRHCGGHGRCVAGGCVCSFPYTGDSCEKRLLDKLQGPVMYGAVAACAGVLLLIVVLVVVLKRRTSDRLAVLKPSRKIQNQELLRRSARSPQPPLEDRWDGGEFWLF